jgi:hypothetical protein
MIFINWLYCTIVNYCYALLQIAIGNVLLIMIPRSWYIGVIVLIFAISDSMYYRVSQVLPTSISMYILVYIDNVLSMR